MAGCRTEKIKPSLKQKDITIQQQNELELITKFTVKKFNISYIYWVSGKVGLSVLKIGDTSMINSGLHACGFNF